MKLWKQALISSLALFSTALTAASQGTSAPAATVGTLKCEVPNRGTFMLHGTMPIAPRNFTRNSCPFTVLDPSGQPLPTQWERVARLRDFDIIELRAPVLQNTWSGTKTFRVIEKKSVQNVKLFDRQALAMAGIAGTMNLKLTDQQGTVHTFPLSGLYPRTRFHRLGVGSITAHNAQDTAFGGFQSWLTVNAGTREVEVILNWHNGALPAQPDVYFRSLELELATGWTFTRILPDPSISPPYLVRASNHIIPQRWERSFRFIVHPSSRTPDVTGSGFAVGDWSQGGYMAQAIALPDLSHTTINLSSKKNDDFWRLGANLPTAPGAQPVNYLWPAQGVYYGGMASGTDINQFPAVPLAVSAQPEGLLSLWIEQLRYSARHPGAIYLNGKPIEMDNYLNGNGTMPWLLFNNVFWGNPVKDTPFFFSKTGPGVGTANYDPTIFNPIDAQHFVRRSKANKALAWLDNDPLARLYLKMDAELSRMSYYEGPGGLLKVPSTPGLGAEMGRAEGWQGDLMATVFALEDDAWRVRTAPWFLAFANALTVAQLPTGLLSSIDHGKIATEAPYGDGQNAFYAAHRSNEQVYLMLALRGFQQVGGIQSNAVLKRVSEGLWSYAWKGSGVLERYPVGPVGGAPWTSRSQIPAGLTSTVPADNWQVGTMMSFGYDEGAVGMLPAILAWTLTNDLPAAKAKMESWGLDNIANRCATLATLQKLVP